MDANSAEHVEALYRAAVGAKKADFYVPKFVKFDTSGASKLSWNWSAFLVTFYWFLYRRMYANWAIYCVLVPILLNVVTGLAQISHGELGRWIFLVSTLGYSFVVLPLFANFFYYRSIKRRIEALIAKVPEPAGQLLVLNNSPATSNIIVVLIPFVGITLLGILAAIAIPAYQAYTIRSQVGEGFLLTAQLKTAVVKSYQSNGAWPSSISELSLSQPLSGRYVASLAVEDGTVTVTYGNQSNPLIGNRRLSFSPLLAANGAVTWTCGYSAPADLPATAHSSAPNLTDIPPQYLPSECRTARH